MAQSEELKAEANKAFQEDHYVKAIELYTRYVLRGSPQNDAMNRAFSCQQVEYDAVMSNFTACMI